MSEFINKIVNDIVTEKGDIFNIKINKTKKNLVGVIKIILCH